MPPVKSFVWCIILAAWKWSTTVLIQFPMDYWAYKKIPSFRTRWINDVAFAKSALVQIMTETAPWVFTHRHKLCARFEIRRFCAFWKFEIQMFFCFFPNFQATLTAKINFNSKLFKQASWAAHRLWPPCPRGTKEGIFPILISIQLSDSMFWIVFWQRAQIFLSGIKGC